MSTARRFSGYAWATLAVNMVVILWGAYVRATGSGAGCGSHWPLCNGQVVPLGAEVTTLVEFSHRLSSGVALLMVAGLFIWARRAFPQRHPARLGASLSLVFIVLEALIGAGLVLFELVAGDTSAARALSISIHLINTFLLLASLTLTGWWAAGNPPVAVRRQGIRAWILGIGLLGMLLVGMTGAVTALGDTLFPPESLVDGFRQDFTAGTHFLVRLRVAHPVLAVSVGLFLLITAGGLGRSGDPRLKAGPGRSLKTLVLVQIAAGAINVVLLAPVWLQMLHLLLADLTWIALVLMAADDLQRRPAPAGETESRSTVGGVQMPAPR